ncbi:MAG: HU family DNA-binding protein [bacterium]
MTKKDLGLQVAEKLGFKKDDAILIVNKIFSAITEILKENKRIEIRGFGSFAVVQRKPKKGRIIKTQEVVNIPSQKTVVFIRGKKMENLELGFKI